MLHLVEGHGGEHGQVNEVHQDVEQEEAPGEAAPLVLQQTTERLHLQHLRTVLMEHIMTEPLVLESMRLEEGCGFTQMDQPRDQPPFMRATWGNTTIVFF